MTRNYSSRTAEYEANKRKIIIIIGKYHFIFIPFKGCSFPALISYD